MRLVVDISVERGAFALNAALDAPLDGITVVFGPSGAGKSLLLSAIAGLTPLERGGIRLGDRAVQDVPPHAREIGMVFQDARLFPHLNVRQNLAYAEARAPRRLIGLDEAAARFDIAALLDRPVRNLSGGEKSRVALARALLSAPALLLLDEPFAALDGVRRRAFLDSLRAMHEEFALPMIVVTHQIDDAAALGDHLIALREGRVVAGGTLRETALLPDFQALLEARDLGAALPAAAVATGEAERRSSVWVRADHVLIARAQPQGLSARNIWTARIVAMRPEDGGALLITLQTEAGAVLSRVTAAAAADLALAPDVDAWAIVKAHSV
ncbi:MAG: ATP-binding cassette domain-containing protein [Terricaulis silvestris]